MELDRNKLDIALARKCFSIVDLRKAVGGSTISKVIQGKLPLRPKTLGKIAKALDVDPMEIIKEE